MSEWIGNCFHTMLAVTPWATALAVALLATRRLLGRRVSARAYRLIWLLLALRLALPADVSLPQAPLTLELPTATHPVAGDGGIAVPEDGQVLMTPEGQTVAVVTPGPQAGQLSETGRVRIFRAAPWIWAGGAALFLAGSLAAYGAFWTKLRRLRRTADPELQARVRFRFGCRMRVYQAPGLASPMLAGLLRPALYLPEDVAPENLAYILAHEAQHRRALDVPYQFVLLAANAVQWFNPVVYWMARTARRDLELACDEAVLAGHDADYRRAYGAAVLDTLRRGQLHSRLSTGFAGDGKTLKNRFVQMFDGTKKSASLPIAAALALCVAATSALVACVPPERAAPAPSDSVSSGPPAQSVSAAQSASESMAGTSQAPVWPVQTSREISIGYMEGHPAIDIPAAEGAEVCAVSAGTVLQAGEDADHGLHVVLENGEETQTYAHLSALAEGVEAGGTVEAGALLGYVGHTGTASGNHLHLEIAVEGKPVDPLLRYPQLGDRVTLPEGSGAEGIQAQQEELENLQEQYEQAEKEWANWASRSIFDQQDSTADGELLWPLPGVYRISSDYGTQRTIYGVKDIHRGLDIPAPEGTPVYAAADGIVSTLASWNYGICLKISHGGTLTTVYAHLQEREPGITDGVEVRRGDLIGYVGTTGNSTGSHLHFEVNEDGCPAEAQRYLDPDVVAQFTTPQL